MFHSKYLKLADTLLEKGISDYDHPFHQCVFGSQSSDSVAQRMVVIRKWDLDRQTFIFHTDRRSNKIKEIKTNSQCSLLFYSHPDQLQLRFQCVSHVHYDDRIAQHIFSQTTENQRKLYQNIGAPGTLKKEEESDDVTQHPIDNFSVVVCNFTSLDYLHLNHHDPIRILFNWDKKGAIRSKNLWP